MSVSLVLAQIRLIFAYSFVEHVAKNDLLGDTSRVAYTGGRDRARRDFWNRQISAACVLH